MKAFTKLLTLEWPRSHHWLGDLPSPHLQSSLLPKQPTDHQPPTAQSLKETSSNVQNSREILGSRPDDTPFFEEEWNYKKMSQELRVSCISTSVTCSSGYPRINACDFSILPTWATKKTLITFQLNPGCLIGILIMAYYNPYITG